MIKEIAQRMLKKASDFGASDIYILPARTGFSVVFRKSAHREYDQLLSDAEGQSLISHFKFTAGMNVGEKRRPWLANFPYEMWNGSPLATAAPRESPALNVTSRTSTHAASGTPP